MEENGTKKTNSAMETTTLTRVPESERRPWWSLAFIWAGSVICIPALMVGSMVMAGMDFKQSCLCMVIGYVIVVFYMCLMGIQSSDLGLPCTVAISRAYGVRGSSFLVSLIIAISNIGWFGSQTALCATSFCNIMSGYLHVDFPLWLSCIIWGCLMFITSVYGVKLIDFLNRISVPALFIMLIWGVISALMRGAAAAVTAYQRLSSLAGLTELRWLWRALPPARSPVAIIPVMARAVRILFSPASWASCLLVSVR